MFARIYQPPKTAMQSGKANTQVWILEFAPASARTPDPLTGWISSTDMDAEIRLTFETKDQAVAYAQKNGIAFRIVETPATKPILKAYADNFASNRKQSWTH